jgi:hypothetical protein
VKQKGKVNSQQNFGFVKLYSNRYSINSMFSEMEETVKIEEGKEVIAFT